MSETADNNDNPANADDTEGVSPERSADTVNNQSENTADAERERRKRDIFRRAASNLTASHADDDDK